MKLKFFARGGNAAALADYVGKVGFNAALPHVAKHAAGGNVERAKRVVGKLKGLAKKRGTLAPEHAYGKKKAKKGGLAGGGALFVKDDQPVAAPAAPAPSATASTVGRAKWNAIKPTAAVAAKQYGGAPNKKWFKSLVERQHAFLKGGTGPGSRGGKVIGYTRSGKAVYQGREADHPAHKDWTPQDHADAAEKHAMHAAEHGVEFDEAMQDAVAKEGKGGWGKLEAVTHPRSKRRFYSEGTQRSIYEPRRRGQLATDIANQHRALADKDAARGVRARSIKRGYQDAEEHEGLTHAQAQARQSQFSRDSAGIVGATSPKRAWGPPPATGRRPMAIGGGTDDYYPPIKKSITERQRAFLKGDGQGELFKPKGEGSRGGQVIGHTRGGKTKYGQKRPYKTPWPKPKDGPPIHGMKPEVQAEYDRQKAEKKTARGIAGLQMPRADDPGEVAYRRREFADPGGRSALTRGARTLPCPTCKEPNRLTAKDKAKGYQCDSCADKEEGPY